MRRAAALSAACAAAAASLIACFDLFHSTAALRTACEIDAATPGCEAAQEGGAAGDGGTDFCSFTRDEARAAARHACAWLGACESPMGRNAFGACMFEALLAYDCRANPSHPSRGEAHALWDCLWQARTCRDVDRCVFSGDAPVCAAPGDFTSCAAGPSGRPEVRVECAGDAAARAARASGENCALWAQTCAAGAGAAACAGGGGLDCTTSGCFASRTQLRWCVDGGDIGIDCASNGAQRCDGLPTTSDLRWVACEALGDGGACTPEPSATCSGGVATSCPSGVPEQIDCAALLLQVDGGCAEGSLSPAFDWTSPCAVSPPACAEDTCSDAGSTGCARGAAFPLDCAAEGLGPCRWVSTDRGSARHAACSPP